LPQFFSILLKELISGHSSLHIKRYISQNYFARHLSSSVYTITTHRRIHEEHPNVLEVIELGASKEFPSSGLRLIFQEAICPFAFLCEGEVRRQGELVYRLYVLTVSGVVLLCHLRSPFSYLSGSVLHLDDIVEFSLQIHAQSAKVTAVTAKPGCIVIGRQDGSICSYSLGKLAPNTPDMSSTINSQKQSHCSGFNVFQIIGLGAFCSSPNGF